MIRSCTSEDFETIYAIVNDAAQAYRGVIPDDCWHDPYMSREELRREIDAGVRFAGFERDGRLLGVMGEQDVQDVTLIRHAYVATAHHGSGIGAALIQHLQARASRRLLVGTWTAATWAIRFYERHGFRLHTAKESEALLLRYWRISHRQIETSVVLSDG
ncbi:MAG TPA: GNAT family N-acetyltransferase [Burkholderiales bacterium]|nr:GNAT family N-acetyltransferase [Burkholderiales bacterium]